MRRIITLSVILFLLASSFAVAQSDDMTASLPVLELELREMAIDILNHDSLDYKVELNKKFIERLERILSRPESFEYPFDSLNTLSLLRAEDNTFRIITWQIVDMQGDVYYSTLAHYYFGLVQRKYEDPSENIHYLVIPLMERENLPKNFENLSTTNKSWFGALYYKPRHLDHIETIKSHYYKVVPRSELEIEKAQHKGTPVETLTFIPNRFRKRRARTTEKPILETHKRVREKINYYVLMGFNGWDNRSNYKVLEIMYFDRQDSMKINFGAPILYFSKSLPKMRGLFKYSENAPFSLNTGYVKTGMGKKLMIVFDHLGKPNKGKNGEMWELGPEGTYDALNFTKNFRIFRWEKNVQLKDDYNRNFTPRAMKRQLKDQKKRTVEKLKEAGIYLNPIDKKIPK